MEHHCLCVEDNLVLQRMLRKWFEKLNVEVTQAFDGQQAVDFCQKQKYSLIFMDVAMPIMDGIEATNIIRTSAESLNKNTPIIVFSGLSTAQGFGTDINGFMHKPFSLNDLEEKVKEWAGREVDPTTGMTRNGGASDSSKAHSGSGVNDATLRSTHSSMLTNMGSSSMFAQRKNSGLMQSFQTRALVYENDSAALRLLVDLLQRQGVYVMPTPTPRDLASSLANEPYDIVFFSILPAPSPIDATLSSLRKRPGPNTFAALIALCNVGQNMPSSFANDCAYKPLVEADVIMMLDCWGGMARAVMDVSQQTGEDKMAVFQRLTTECQSRSRAQRAPYLARATFSHVSEGHRAAPRSSVASVVSAATPSRKRPKLESVASLGSRIDASRESHNQKERNRRKDISDAVDDLRHIVPDCTAKTDKANVLKRAVEFAEELTRLARQHSPKELNARLAKIKEREAAWLPGVIPQGSTPNKEMLP